MYHGKIQFHSNLHPCRQLECIRCSDPTLRKEVWIEPIAENSCNDEVEGELDRTLRLLLDEAATVPLPPDRDEDWIDEDEMIGEIDAIEDGLPANNGPNNA